MALRYRTFPTTADMGVYIYGRTHEELFKNAALAFSAIVKGKEVLKPSSEKEITLESPSLETLLFLWLSEFLYFYDTSLFLPVEVRGIKILEKKGFSVWSRIAFGKLLRTPEVYIKAITMHQIKIEKRKGLLRAKVVLDL